VILVFPGQEEPILASLAEYGNAVLYHLCTFFHNGGSNAEEFQESGEILAIY